MATEPRADGTRPVPALRDALRRARAEAAERSSVVVDLRTAELTRLDLLKERIEPVVAQVPSHVELFDLGVAPGDPARLFVDMVGFVELGRDKRTFRFIQDTRLGPVVLAETQDMDEVAAAVTDYVARRLVERERALAAGDLAIADIPARGKIVVHVPERTLPRGVSAAVFAAFALGAAVGAGAILAFGWLWITGSSFAP